MPKKSSSYSKYSHKKSRQDMTDEELEIDDFFNEGKTEDDRLTEQDIADFFNEGKNEDDRLTEQDIADFFNEGSRKIQPVTLKQNPNIYNKRIQSYDKDPYDKYSNTEINEYISNIDAQTWNDFFENNSKSGSNIPTERFSGQGKAMRAIENILSKYSMDNVPILYLYEANVPHMNATQEFDRIYNWKNTGKGKSTAYDVKQLGLDLQQHIKEPVVVIPFVFSTSVETAHANLLIWRPNQHTIERYEPHGATFNSYTDPVLNDYINMGLKTLCRHLQLYLGGHLVYHSPLIIWTLSGLLGYQGLQSNKYQGPILSGTCALWSLIMMDLVLMNPYKETSVFIKFLIDVSDTDPEYICNVIKGYFQYISINYVSEVDLELIKQRSLDYEESKRKQQEYELKKQERLEQERLEQERQKQEFELKKQEYELKKQKYDKVTYYNELLHKSAKELLQILTSLGVKKWKGATRKAHYAHQISDIKFPDVELY